MNFIDLFAGIGGFRSVAEKNGHQCLAYCEIDRYAKQSYDLLYDTSNEIYWSDIKKVTDEDLQKLKGNVDLVFGGFPCQSFSLAGLRKGFSDEEKGGLFFDTHRIISYLKPKYFVLENVVGLFSHNNGESFKVVVRMLASLGYVVEWFTANSSDYGLSQMRKRVFIIGHRTDLNIDRILPIGNHVESNKVSANIVSSVQNFNEGSSHGQRTRVCDLYSATYTIMASDYKNSGQYYYTSEKLWDETCNEDEFNYYRNRIRLSLPLECFLHQGYTEEQFNKLNGKISKSQLYKQAGNSVSIPVVDYIVRLITNIDNSLNNS